MRDSNKRTIDYMRIALTDQCNLRCRYCMPTEDVPCLGRDAMLTDEEILRIVAAGAKLGIKKVRLTGGEPLLRKDIIHILGRIKAIKGIEDIAITTNGLLLGGMLEALVAAGLNRVNLSLDTLKADSYRQVTGADAVAHVTESLKACLNRGIPVKVNAVILKGINEDAILGLMALTYDHAMDVRFIELMPMGPGKNLEGLSTAEIFQKIEAAGLRYQRVVTGKDSGVADYIKLDGAMGKVGFISPLSHQFCDRCNRIRITPEGYLKPCLHSKAGISLRDALRASASDEDLAALIGKGILMKPKGHRFFETTEDEEQRHMNQIGG